MQQARQAGGRRLHQQLRSGFVVADIDCAGLASLRTSGEMRNFEDWRAQRGAAPLSAGVMTQRLLTYAMGRGVETFDLPVVRQILRDAKANDYKWSSVILGVVKSTPFQMRRSREP